MAMYEVRDLAVRKLVVEANSSTQAKRLACKRWRRKASDYWCGITTLTARRLKED